MEIGFFILFACSVSICCSQSVFFPENRGNECKEGTECIWISKCPSILKKALGTSIADENAVRQAVCEFRHRKLLVCCPKSSEKTNLTASSIPEERLIPNNCGIAVIPPVFNVKHIGGPITFLNDYPWMAAIKYKDPFVNESYFGCSASIISSRYLLTAARCVYALGGREIISLNIGDWNISNPGIDCRGYHHGTLCNKHSHVEAKPEKIIIHPNFNRRFRGSDDIALIRIDKELNFNGEQIRHICLPKEDFNAKSIDPNIKAVIAGWGLAGNSIESTILLQSKIPFADRELCKNRYKGNFDAYSQICAFGNGGKAACISDSGGPLMMATAHGSPYTQIGIATSEPQTCISNNLPSLFTNVAYYKLWIISNMKP